MFEIQAIFVPNFRKWCLDILAVILLESKLKEQKVHILNIGFKIQCIAL